MSAMNGVRTNPKLKPPPVRLYKYRMAGIPKPIIIAAATREKARELLGKLIAKSPTPPKVGSTRRDGGTANFGGDDYPPGRA